MILKEEVVKWFLREDLRPSILVDETPDKEVRWVIRVSVTVGSVLVWGPGSNQKEYTFLISSYLSFNIGTEKSRPKRRDQRVKSPSRERRIEVVMRHRLWRVVKSRTKKDLRGRRKKILKEEKPYLCVILESLGRILYYLVL